MIASGQLCGLHVAIEPAVLCGTGGKKALSGGGADLVPKLNQPGIGADDFRFNQDFVIVTGRGEKTALRFDDGKQNSLRVLQVLIVEAARPNQFYPSDFHPDEVIGMIDDPHLIGFGISHAKADLVPGHGYQGTGCDC